MKNKILPLSLLFLGLLVSGCGEVSSSSSSENSSQSSSVQQESFYDESELGEREFRVKVLYPNSNPVNHKGLAAMWCTDSTCYLPVKVDGNGVARTTIKEDGADKYYVHLTNLPKGYTYNANAYEMTPINRDIVITLVEGGSLGNGTGELYNFYNVTEGAYIGTANEIDQEVFYSFRPSKPGVYEIETWAYDSGGVQVTLGYYGNNEQLVPETPYEETSTGGLKGNVKYQFRCEPSSFSGSVEENNLTVGSGYIFSLKVSGDLIFPPFDFGFEIKFVEDIVLEKEEETPTGPIEVEVQEALSTYPNNETTAKLTVMPLDGSLQVVYNDEDRFYHVGDKNGPEVLVRLTKSTKYIETPLTKITETGRGIPGDTSYFILDNNTKNYEPLVDEYAKYVNKDGVYPATEELKTMLKLISDKQKYFDSAELTPGWIYSYLGYEVAEENQWLWACYYYKA